MKRTASLQEIKLDTAWPSALLAGADIGRLMDTGDGAGHVTGRQRGMEADKLASC